MFIKSVLKDDLPKLQKAGINLQVLYKSIKKLETNPYGSSRAKTGDLDTIRGMDWGKGYRVLFEIKERDKIIKIIAIDAHDNAYRKTKKRK